ncbi:serine/threonine-protein kinase [Nonomuraea aurantiaca]|uniref:serine/threonine-protein kinase n=1 Tax=Nonomuraea aurantiaca TaxID=2878562 RepID=UPI001CDA27D7|nr:serine/threonine-protein kinase [Nonomuraea aurantiaca]MCA2219734.1 serine/threonine protein kinase [Nonomuraea aurantiaca]
MVSDSNRLVAKRYQLLRELGRGGMGVVWEGRDTLLNRQIAVKEVLLPAGLPRADQERQLLRTAREARMAARLNHPSVVAIYDVVEEDGRPWIIMELVRYPSVEEVVATSGALPVRQAADVGRQVLSALRAAHEVGILHRDVKPSNILLTDDGRAVLTDFGIATAEGDASLTQTGMVTGSPSFLAPERVRAAESGPASDLWSLGATLYATLVGRSPFERGDPMATLNALLSEEPDYRRIPPIMHPVLQGLLRKEPHERVNAEQADALLAAVVAAKQPNADRVVVEPKPPRGGRTLLAAAAAAVLVVAGGGFAFFKFSGSAEGAPRVTQSAVTSAPPSTPPPSAKTSATPTPTPTPTPTRVVAAVRAWKSPDGWSIMRPTGWKGARKEAYTEWTRRDRTGHFGVQAIYVNLDPNQIIRDSQETAGQNDQDLRTLRRRSVTHQGTKAVEWEFTYTAGPPGDAPWSTQGVKYHEVQRAVAIGDTAYILSWTATEARWRQDQGLMRQVIASFTVAA